MEFDDWFDDLDLSFGLQKMYFDDDDSNDKDEDTKDVKPESNLYLKNEKFQDVKQIGLIDSSKLQQSQEEDTAADVPQHTRQDVISNDVSEFLIGFRQNQHFPLQFIQQEQKSEQKKEQKKERKVQEEEENKSNNEQSDEQQKLQNQKDIKTDDEQQQQQRKQNIKTQQRLFPLAQLPFLILQQQPNEQQHQNQRIQYGIQISIDQLQVSGQIQDSKANTRKSVQIQLEQHGLSSYYHNQQDNSYDGDCQLTQLDNLFVNPEAIHLYSQANPLYVTIQELAKLYPLQLKVSQFVRLTHRYLNHKSQEQKVFKAFIVDWAKTSNRLGKKILTLAKIRTIIVRDAMNNLVDQIIPPNQDEDIHLRISKQYRQRYHNAKVPIPPPRVNNSYLETIFKNNKIKQFYFQYIEEKLQLFLKQQNYRRIELYTLEIMKCFYLSKNKSQEQLIAALEKIKKPYTYKEQQIIIQEAKKIGKQYGNAKKRIGNGNGKNRQRNLLNENQCKQEDKQIKITRKYRTKKNKLLSEQQQVKLEYVQQPVKEEEENKIHEKKVKKKTKPIKKQKKQKQNTKTISKQQDLFFESSQSQTQSQNNSTFSITSNQLQQEFNQQIIFDY